MCNDFDKNAMSLFADRFGKLVDRKKETEKISMDKLADELKISKPTLYRWKNGETMPNPGSLSLICEYFSVPKNYFAPDAKDRIFFDHAFHEQQHKEDAEFAKNIGLSVNFVAFLKENPALADAIISASYVDASDSSFSESIPETDSPFQFVSSSGVKIYLPFMVLDVLRDIQKEISDYALYFIQKRIKEKAFDFYSSESLDGFPELKKLVVEIEKKRPDTSEETNEIIREFFAAVACVFTAQKGKTEFGILGNTILSNVAAAAEENGLSMEENGLSMKKDNFLVELDSSTGSVDRILIKPGLKGIHFTVSNG